MKNRAIKIIGSSLLALSLIGSSVVSANANDIEKRVRKENAPACFREITRRPLADLFKYYKIVDSEYEMRPLDKSCKECLWEVTKDKYPDVVLIGSYQLLGGGIKCIGKAVVPK